MANNPKNYKTYYSNEFSLDAISLVSMYKVYNKSGMLEITPLHRKSLIVNVAEAEIPS